MTNRLLRNRGLDCLPLTLALAVALAGCKNTPSTPTTSSGSGTSAPPVAGAPTFKLITNGLSPFWDSLAKGMDDADKQLGTNASWQGPQPSQNAEQVKIFNDAIAAKADGIGLSAIAPDAIAPTIDKAVDAGIPVICFDSDAPQSKRVAYLGTDNYEAGKLAGQETVKQFPNGGKLIAFVGTMSQQNALDRYNGFKDALKGSSIQFIAEPFLDNQDKNQARKNVEDAITRYQDQGLNGLVGLYSYDGPAIIGAVQARNLRSKMKVICFDGDPETLKGLGDGMVDVTVVQKPYEFGRLSIMLLNLLHKDKTFDAAIKDLQPELDKLNMKVDMATHKIDTGVTVVTKDNAAQFLKDLKEKGIEST